MPVPAWPGHVLAPCEQRPAEPLRRERSTNGGPRQPSPTLAQPVGLGARGGRLKNFIAAEAESAPTSATFCRSGSAHAVDSYGETEGGRHAEELSYPDTLHCVKCAEKLKSHEFATRLNHSS